jgi:hypothetical protein
MTNLVDFNVGPQIRHFWSNSELFSFNFEIRPSLICRSLKKFDVSVLSVYFLVSSVTRAKKIEN